MVKVISLIILIMTYNASASNVYKWVDEDGNVTYSEERPKNHTYKKMEREDLDNLTTTEPPKRMVYRETRSNVKQISTTNSPAKESRREQLKRTCARLEKKVKAAEKKLKALGLGNKWARENKRRAQAELTDECWRKR